MKGKVEKSVKVNKVVKARTVEQQIKIVQGAKSVKGVYFTMDKFVRDHKLPPFEKKLKKDIGLEEYKALALEYLRSHASELALEEAVVPVSNTSLGSSTVAL